MRGPVLALGTLLLPLGALAHPLAPALLEMREIAPERYAVQWRTTVVQARGTRIAPRLPESCRSLNAPEQRVEAGEAVVLRWVVQCGPGGLVGARVTVDGLAAAGINVIVAIVPRDGPARSALLGAGSSSYVVPAPQSDAPVFPRYLRLGIDHLLAGADHLLFLLGLFLLVRSPGVLVAAVTAFTLGHCVTLTLVTLGVLRIPQALAELAIAVTVLLVACALARPAERSLGSRAQAAAGPVAIAASFGLIHGAGFAGALREIGLPAGEVPMALLAFNLGIEAGQLLVIAALLALATLWRRMSTSTRTPAARRVPAYVIGTCAVYWCFERAWLLLAPMA